jgi:hypothetical protein
MRFQVITAASMKMVVLWNVAPCTLVDNDRRVRGAYWLHHHCDHRPQHKFSISLIICRLC